MLDIDTRLETAPTKDYSDRLLEELKTRTMHWRDVRSEAFQEARREYENAARLLRHACALGEFKVAPATAEKPAGRAALAEQATALAEDMRAILAEHRTLRLARNRAGGLEEGSGARFQRMIDAYRRIAKG